MEETKKLMKEVESYIPQLPTSIATLLSEPRSYKCVKIRYLIMGKLNKYIDKGNNEKLLLLISGYCLKRRSELLMIFYKKYYLSISYVSIVLKQIFRKCILYELKLARSAKMFVKHVQSLIFNVSSKIDWYTRRNAVLLRMSRHYKVDLVKVI